MLSFMSQDKDSKQNTEVVETNSNVLTPTIFSNDILFLMFSIKHNLKTSLNVIIDTELNKEFIKESGLKNLCSSVAHSVILSMSESYKRLLLNYWNEEGLNDFIVSTITYELTNLSIKLNNSRIKGDVTNNNPILSRKNDILTDYN